MGGDLLQIAGPEQPMVAVREAHVDGNVLLAPVSANDLADHAPPPWDPVVSAHPHLHAHEACFFCAHKALPPVAQFRSKPS